MHQIEVENEWQLSEKPYCDRNPVLLSFYQFVRRLRDEPENPDNNLDYPPADSNSESSPDNDDGDEGDARGKKHYNSRKTLFFKEQKA